MACSNRRFTTNKEPESHLLALGDLMFLFWQEGLLALLASEKARRPSGSSPVLNLGHRCSYCAKGIPGVLRPMSFDTHSKQQRNTNNHIVDYLACPPRESRHHHPYSQKLVPSKVDANVLGFSAPHPSPTLAPVFTTCQASK